MAEFEYKEDLDVLVVESSDYDSYKSSVEFGNFVVDISHEGDVIGVEIIDASENTPLSREELSHITDAEIRVKYHNEYMVVAIFAYTDGSKNVLSSTVPLATA